MKPPEPATLTNNSEGFGQEIPVLGGGKQISAHIGSESVQFVFSLGLDMAVKDVGDALEAVLDLWKSIARVSRQSYPRKE